MAKLSDLQSRIESAVAALDAGNYASALTLARGAALLIVAVPDSEFQGEKITIDRESLKNTIAELNRAAASAAMASNGGIVTQDITVTRG
jgi:exosome complex RNA-binding protein Rrp42 (RNase PH superfamily)